MINSKNKLYFYYIVFCLLIFAAILYFVIEGIVAHAWPSPGYSYVNNYVSDLGVPLCTTTNRFVCSPLHGLMNSTFFMVGGLSLIGILSFASLFTGKKRWSISSLGIIQSIGIMMVGVAPGSFAEDITNDRLQMALHTLGALFGIIGTALLAFIIGAIVLRRSRLFGSLSITLGLLPIISLVLQSVTGIESLGLGRGGFERLGVYSVVIWLAVVGVWSLARVHRLNNSKRTSAYKL